MRQEFPQTKAQEPPADLCARVCRPAGARAGLQRTPRLGLSCHLATAPNTPPTTAPFIGRTWRAPSRLLDPPLPSRAGANQGHVSRSQMALCPTVLLPPRLLARGPAAEAHQTARPARPDTRSPVREVIRLRPSAPPRHVLEASSGWERPRSSTPAPHPGSRVQTPCQLPLVAPGDAHGPVGEGQGRRHCNLGT